MSEKTAKILIDGKEIELPVFVGTEGEMAIDIRTLRPKHGIVTYDPGYGSTGSCQSKVTFVDGEKGILRFRGYQIEELAEKATFIEVAYLSIFGELPTTEQIMKFRDDLNANDMIHEDLKHFFDFFPPGSHPMAVLSSMITALSTFYPSQDNPEDWDKDIILLIAKVKTLAAYAYRKSLGLPYIYPSSDLTYVGDFLQMMFKKGPNIDYKVNPVVEKALTKLLILHLDHEQNCSASTVRMVGSAQGNIYTVISAGVAALWGPLHGGANQKVLDMLAEIHASGGDYQKYMDMAKDKDSGFRLMGFGHRVYKNFDPRAQILKASAEEILREMKIEDPLLDIAFNLERIALEDEYFVKRNLYPNVDFYSGIIYKALGIPENMMTVMFTLGRLPGWLAQWRESRSDPDFRIHRPRQIFQGATKRSWVDRADR